MIGLLCLLHRVGFSIESFRLALTRATGSPEMVGSMLVGGAGQPDAAWYEHAHRSLAERGLRVIALAWAPFPAGVSESVSTLAIGSSVDTVAPVCCLFLMLASSLYLVDMPTPATEDCGRATRDIRNTAALCRCEAGHWCWNADAVSAVAECFLVDFFLCC